MYERLHKLTQFILFLQITYGDARRCFLHLALDFESIDRWVECKMPPPPLFYSYEFDKIQIANKISRYIVDIWAQIIAEHPSFRYWHSFEVYDEGDDWLRRSEIEIKLHGEDRCIVRKPQTGFESYLHTAAND